MTHDLDKYLDEVRGRFERFPKNVVICWVDDFKDGKRFRTCAECCCPTRTRPMWVIGVSRRLRKAPAYVLRWLVTHEALHVVMPGYRRGGGGVHHLAFRRAERAHPDYMRACAWLDAHT